MTLSGASPPVILAIDTAAAQCAVAVLRGPAPVAERAAMARGHAEALFPMIERALARAGLAYADLERIAVCTGPGSFTGVRIGVSAARGLGLALGVPVIGISRLEALAAEVIGEVAGEVGGEFTGEAREAVAVCLAGRGETAYIQVFAADGRPAGEPEMTTLAALDASLPPAVGRFAGDAAWRVAGESALLADGLPDPAVIARLAAGRAPGAPPRPLYLRGADAAPPREAPTPLLD